ncbi:MAG: bifunctional nuclease domain-containing protein [Verrucomicrobiia bacterium]
MTPALLALGLALIASPPSPMVEAEVASVGIDTRSGSPIAILREKDGGRIVPIWIGLPEGRAIAIALAGIELPRPQTHDLIQSILESSGLKLREIHITELRDNTYFARLLLDPQPNRPTPAPPPINIDSRPSDAIAIALRAKAPILVSRDLLIALPDVDISLGEPGQQILRILGFTVVRASPEALANAGLPPTTSGLEVIAVGESADGQVRPGDILLTANGLKLAAPADLIDIVREEPRDATILLQIGRDGSILELQLPVLEPLRTPTPSTPSESL